MNILSNHWSRVRRRLSGALEDTAPPVVVPCVPSTNDYKAAWNDAARGDARSAVLTGSTDDYFESSGRGDADRVRRHLRGGDTILSIGCGIGRVERYLAPEVALLHAIDVSGEMLDRARERLCDSPNVRLLEVGNRDFLGAFEPRTFDLVYAFLVLQHLEKEDALRYIREAALKLKAGGVFVAQFPNYLSPEYSRVLLDEVEAATRSPGRVRPYTADEVRHSFEILGYEILDFTFAWGELGNAEMYVAARPKASPA